MVQALETTPGISMRQGRVSDVICLLIASAFRMFPRLQGVILGQMVEESGVVFLRKYSVLAKKARLSSIQGQLAGPAMANFVFPK